MIEFIKELAELKSTPVPVLLVAGGVLFLLLALAGGFTGRIEIPPPRQKWAGLIGLFLLIFGIALYAMPESQTSTPTPEALATVQVGSATPPVQATVTPVPPANTFAPGPLAVSPTSPPAPLTPTDTTLPPPDTIAPDPPTFTPTFTPTPVTPAIASICTPSLISPGTDAVLDNGRTDTLDAVAWDFDWSDCAGATQYHLFVIHEGAQNPLIDDRRIPGSSYHHEREGSYITNNNRLGWTWKVRAMVDGRWSDWSQARIFAVEPVDSDPPIKIPAPELAFMGTENYTANERQWVRYQLAVNNWAQFPGELFQPAPDLPPCGSNTNASRTWVHIYNASDDAYIYGYCGFSASQNLQSFSFAVAQGTLPPQAVYIVLIDRQENVNYRSNDVTLPR